MDVKKNVSDIKTSVNLRQMSDLEKRKLEVELKAAEEMAKIKEAVIEKRLAFELASLQDSDPNTQSSFFRTRDINESLPRFPNKTENIVTREVQRTEQANRIRIQTPTPQKSTMISIFDDFAKLSTSNMKKSQGTLKTAFVEPKGLVASPAVETADETLSQTEQCDDEDTSTEDDCESQQEEEANCNGDSVENYARVDAGSKLFWKSMVSKMKNKLKFRKPKKW